ncbi:hypothetical protein Tsubulata_022551 [Turnera subulata]|uniref:RING-type domain-containing protein n=1 Tax=Turnera subulata TaxID=218843 RepID=A0A9Q0F574_9ROSI|nr:hypothetical protein Tsubulata_022551 [Turnera subulata]
MSGTTSYDNEVYVTASYCDDFPSDPISDLTVAVDVMKNYVSDSIPRRTSGRVDHMKVLLIADDQRPPKEIRGASAEWRFAFPRVSLTKTTVSGMIKYLRIPFGLEKVQWRARYKDNWTRLESEDDVVARIFDVISNPKNAGVSEETASTRNLALSLRIKQEIVLPHEEYMETVERKRKEELAQRAYESITALFRMEAAGGERMSPRRRESTLREIAEKGGLDQPMFEQILRESALVSATTQQQQQGGSRRVPAAKLAVKKMEEEIIGPDSKKIMCAVCREEMKIGSMAACMPCSHKFHKTCIDMWLNRSRTCPMCRSKLPVTETSVWSGPRF